MSDTVYAYGDPPRTKDVDLIHHEHLVELMHRAALCGGLEDELKQYKRVVLALMREPYREGRYVSLTITAEIDGIDPDDLEFRDFGDKFLPAVVDKKAL